MENGKIRGIRTLKPLNRLSRNLAWMITSLMWPRTPKSALITPTGASQQMGEIVLSLFFNFLWPPVFPGIQRLNHRSDFDTVWFIERQSSRDKTAKRFYVPHFYPKKGAWIGIFKPNSQYIKTSILSKPLHRFQPNFAQWQRPTNALCGWSKYT